MSVVAAETVAPASAHAGPTLSVAVVAHNEEGQLAACLAAPKPDAVSVHCGLLSRHGSHLAVDVGSVRGEVLMGDLVRVVLFKSEFLAAHADSS